MKQVTIKDIARIAGLSSATVSRALNGMPEVSEQTRERVRAICAREGYRANSLAQSLISSRTHVIALVMRDITHPFYAELALHIEVAARAGNDTIMVCNTLRDVERLGELLDRLAGYQVDGVIVASSRSEVEEYLRTHPPAIPTLLLGDSFGHISNSVCSRIGINNLRVGQIGTDYLIGMGHRDIVYLGCRADSASHTQRSGGYRISMERHGLEPFTLPRGDSEASMDAGYALASALFSSGRPCSAVFAASDLLALGVMQAADERGIRIPQDISLMGVGNTGVSGLPRTNLTTVDERKKQMAQSAVELLREQIEGEEEGRITHRMIQPELVIRETCAPPGS